MGLFDKQPQYNMAGGKVQPQGGGFDYQSLLGNPLLHAGIGLLGSQKGQGAQAALQGLMQGQQYKQQFAAQDKASAEEERLQQLSQSLPGLYADQGIGGVGQALLGNPSTMAQGAGLIGKAAGRGTDDPSAVREYQYFQNLAPDQQSEFLRVKRAQQMFGAGGVQYGVDQGSGAVNQLVDPNQVAQNAATIAGATAQASTTAKAGATATAQAPQSVENANNMLSVLDKAINHPGRELATGFSSTFNKFQPAGSQARDFLTVTDQIKGAAFLQAFESLKGGGQITEVEGKKGTDAIARLNEAQSEGEYLAALNDFKAIVTRGKERAEGRLGAGSTAGNVASPMTDDDYAALPSGSIYTDPDDGKQYRKP
jgi:hypothetical protein